MKIVVDINHPAHVHYFKNFIWEMEKRGHVLLITASEKEVSYRLLDNYKFHYVKFGTYGKSLVKKMFMIPLLDMRMYFAVKKFKPDIFLGFGSIRAAHASKLMGKPCIALDDTEHARWEHLLYVPFTNAILTPACFNKDFGKKQVRYNGYTELAYLHPRYFKPNPSVLHEIGVGKNEPYMLLRFVSWSASHDVGQQGIRNKYDLVKKLEKYGRVFISSEEPLPSELRDYSLKLSPEKIHDVLYFAHLYLGEGGTMATEAALLGTPALFVSSLAGTMGNFIELEKKYGLMYSYKDPDRAIEKATELLHQNNLKECWQQKRDKLLNDKIDVTAFLIDFVEKYHDTHNPGKAKWVWKH